MLRKMNSKEKQLVFRKVREQWGCELPKGTYLINKKNKIWVIYKLPKLFNLKVDRIGLYVGQLNKDGVRLSIEGAQIIRPKKNFISLNKEQMILWLKGEEITLPKNKNIGYVIIKYGNKVLGCGKVSSNGVLHNYVPKNRRIQNLVE